MPTTFASFLTFWSRVTKSEVSRATGTMPGRALSKLTTVDTFRPFGVRVESTVAR